VIVGPLSRILTALLLGGTLAADRAAASEAGNAAGPEALLFEDVAVSAASKHAQPQREAPSAVTVVTREEIRRFGYRTLAEVLRSVRGFYISGDRNYDNVGVRGFLRPGDYSDRVLLLVNGHTYNNDVYWQSYLGQDFGIDLEAVDHIEVIRGPGSALYGGNALFAVINVVTTTGAENPGVHTLAETGSFWRKRGQASVGHVTEGGLDVFASGSVLDVDGPEELFYPAFDSPATHNGIARNADAERALKFFSSARYGDFTLQGGTNSREQHVPTGAYGTTFGDTGTKTVDQRRFAEASYEHLLPEDVELTTRLFYDGMRYNGTYIYGAGPTRTKNKDLSSSDWFGTEIRARRRLFEGNAITAGTEYTYHPHVVQENFDVPSGITYLHDVRSFGTLGIYAQDEWLVVPNVTLIGGLRFDRYYDRIQQLSPRVAGVWTPLPTTAVKLLYGNAFRPPNLYEEFYAYPSVGIRSLANPGLDPERITTYEGVLDQTLWGRAQASLALYRYDISDLIEQVRVTVPGYSGRVLQFQNTGSAIAHGAEAEVRVPLPRSAAGRIAYSIQDARDAQDHVLSNSPKHLGNVGLLVPLAAGISAGAELIVVGPRRTLGGAHLETARILNLNLIYATPIRGVDLTCGLYNLLDQSYPDPAPASLIEDRVPQDGFTFRLQLEYAF
jgi:iron complex outermembrane receptor protein